MDRARGRAVPSEPRGDGLLERAPVVALLFGLLALAMTWPLAASMTTRLPLGSGDLWQNLWNFWWWKHSLVDLHQSPFHTEHLFFPFGAPLVFHTHSPFNQLVALPVNLLFGPVAAYNFAILLGFVLAGLGAYLLARDLTGDGASAFVAGVVFAFFPHHFEQTLEHVNLASIQFLPFVALYGLRTLRRGRLGDAVGLGVCFALNAASSWHYALFTLFVLPWIWLVELTRLRERPPAARHVARLAAAGAIAALLTAPIAWPLLREMASGTAFAKAPMARGVDLAFLLLPSDQHPLLGRFTAGLYRAHRAYPSAGFLAYVGVSVLALAAFSAGAVRRERQTLAWWIIAATTCVLALGAHPLFLGRSLDLGFPLASFDGVPLLASLRVANRFVVLTMLALAVLAALGSAELRRRVAWAPSAAAAVVLLDFLWLPYPTQPVAPSPGAALLAGSVERGGVLDIPFAGDHTAVRNHAFQTLHGRPMAGGYVSVTPASLLATRADPVLGPLMGPTPAVPDRIDAAHLRRLVFGDVVFHKDFVRERLAERCEARDESASPYERRIFRPEWGIPQATFDALSARMTAAVGAPVYEDESVRIFSLR